MEREQAVRLTQNLLRKMVEREGSDLFITAAFPPSDLEASTADRPARIRTLAPQESTGHLWVAWSGTIGE